MVPLWRVCYVFSITYAFIGGRMKRSVTVLGVVFLIATLHVSAAQTAHERETIIDGVWKGFSFGSYASVGTGVAASLAGDFYPVVMELAAGFRIRPWLAVGAYTSASQLSPFDFGGFRPVVLSRANGYGIASGTEVILTPWAEKFVHPFVRIAAGGRSVGTLVDEDGTEGYEAVVEYRFFHAALSLGAEVNIGAHSSVFVRSGWQFTGNNRIFDLDEGELSGAEIVIGGRFVWNTRVW